MHLIGKIVHTTAPLAYMYIPYPWTMAERGSLLEHMLYLAHLDTHFMELFSHSVDHYWHKLGLIVSLYTNAFYIQL